MIISSILSVAFYMIRSECLEQSIKAIHENPFNIINFHSALNWASWENSSITFAIFMVTLKLLNLIRFNPHVIYFFSSFRQSQSYQLSYAFFFFIAFNAFVISGIQFFGSSVHAYSTYMQAVTSQFEFLLGKAKSLAGLRSEYPFLGRAFASMYTLCMTIFLMNMIVSVLNEAYTDARTNTEESAEELVMAHFIGERFEDIFQEGKRRTEFKLFCDDATFTNMCSSEAEPYCLNSETIIQCTEERMSKLDRRLLALRRRSENLQGDHVKEEAEFLDLLSLMANEMEDRPSCP